MFYKSVLYSYRAGAAQEPKMNIGHLDPGDQGPKVLDKESWFKGQRYHLGGGLQVAEDDFKENIAKGTDPRIEFCLPKLLITRQLASFTAKSNKSHGVSE